MFQLIFNKINTVHRICLRFLHQVKVLEGDYHPKFNIWLLEEAESPEF